MTGPGQDPYWGPPQSNPPPVESYAPDHPTAAPYSYGYPSGYPQGYPPANYPMSGYPAPGYPVGYGSSYPADPRDVRPGVTMGAAVLGYVNAGLLILAGGLLLLGASLINDIERATDGHTNFDAEFALDGLANLIAAALLIAGGVMITGRNPTGRVLLTIGNGIVIAETLYWLIRFTGITAAGLIFYAVLFAGLAIVSVVLSWLAPVTNWLSDALRGR